MGWEGYLRLSRAGSLAGTANVRVASVFSPPRAPLRAPPPWRLAAPCDMHSVNAVAFVVSLLAARGCLAGRWRLGARWRSSAGGSGIPPRLSVTSSLLLSPAQALSLGCATRWHCRCSGPALLLVEY
jgi:hypothetical protein